MQFDDPLELFEVWFAQAKLNEPNDPNAMFVATVDESGQPNVRVVLMKDYDASGFVFYTNFESAKGREILAAGKAALCFEWKSLGKQVTLRGPVAPVSDDEADAYYQSRARQSRLGAWASKQSRPLTSKAHLLKEVARYALKFGVGTIPRPPFWSGFRLTPHHIEFRREESEQDPGTHLRYRLNNNQKWLVESSEKPS
ncbi:MAG: pyridoxamine 5'-phosphate oxidase [Rhizobiaceae bacterium]